MDVTAPDPGSVNRTGTLEAQHAYDSEAKMTWMQYPAAWLNNGGFTQPTPTAIHFTMGRLQKMGSSERGGYGIRVEHAYNVDGTLATMNFGGGTESRTYNPLGQLIGISGGPTGVNVGYVFPGTGNNGRISSMTFNGESVTYGYDALNRLISATSNQGWGETYAYDRYGNLTAKNGQSIGVSAATNRLDGGGYDANGNFGGTGGWEYDVENRLTKWSHVSLPDQFYGYDAGNKRVWKRFQQGSSTIEQVFFYSGGRLGTYEIQGALPPARPDTSLTL